MYNNKKLILILILCISLVFIIKICFIVTPSDAVSLYNFVCSLRRTKLELVANDLPTIY
jgi:hypothetical protein